MISAQRQVWKIVRKKDTSNQLVKLFKLLSPHYLLNKELANEFDVDVEQGAYIYSDQNGADAVLANTAIGFARPVC